MGGKARGYVYRVGTRSHLDMFPRGPIPRPKPGSVGVLAMDPASGGCKYTVIPLGKKIWRWP